MARLGNQLQAALTIGVPAELVAMVVTTSHPVRLRNLFHESGLNLLAAHRAVRECETQQRPSSTARQARDRIKALVDLIRARGQSLGERKPGVKAMLGLMDMPALPQNVVHIRKVA